MVGLKPLFSTPTPVHQASIPMNLIKALALSVALASSHCLAESIGAPKIAIGDTWTYQKTIEKPPNTWNQTRDEFTVVRVTSNAILTSVKLSGSTQTPREFLVAKDWSSSRLIDEVETTVYKPLDFPLSTGKSWTLKYTIPNPNPKIKYSRYDLKYTVGESESVEVPGGKFKAVKIEGEGRWSDELEPGQVVTQSAQTNANGTSMTTDTRKVPDIKRSGTVYHAYWYVPDLKRWVKSVEEIYLPDGSRGERKTSELVSFRSGDPSTEPGR